MKEKNENEKFINVEENKSNDNEMEVTDLEVKQLLKAIKRKAYEEDIIEVEVEELMKVIKHSRYATIMLVFSGMVALIYVFILVSQNITLNLIEHIYYWIVIFGTFTLSRFFSKTKWPKKNTESTKVVVKLSESELKSLKKAEGVSEMIDYTEYMKLDIDGDGKLLVSEVYTKAEEDVEKEIKIIDENFSVESFKNYAKSVFVMVQNAWSNNDYKMLRSIQADSLYYRQKLIIEDMSENKFINKRTHIRVKGVLLKDFKIEGDYEILVVMMTANMKITHHEALYSTDNGDFPYVLKFIRKKGVKTKKNDSLATSNCLNCGAVINVDDKGVCKYCGTSLVSGEHDWVLSDIRNIKLSGM